MTYYCLLVSTFQTPPHTHTHIVPTIWETDIKIKAYGMGRGHFQCKEQVSPIVPTFFHLFFKSFLLYLFVRWARASHSTQVGVRGQLVGVRSLL